MKDKSIPKQTDSASYLDNHTRPLSTKEARDYLGLSKDYFYRLTSQRKFAAYRPNGKKLYFLKSDLDNYLLRNRITPVHELEDKAIENVIFGGGK